MWPSAEYRAGDTLIHKLDARVKLILTVTGVLSIALTPVGSWPIYFLWTMMAMAITIVARLPAGRVLKRSAWVLPFAAMAVPLAFTVRGTPLVSVGGLTISAAGSERWVTVICKSWISGLGVIIFSATTPFTEILMATRAMGLPPLLAMVIELMGRYLWVLNEEARRMLRARAARSACSAEACPRRRWLWQAVTLGWLAGSLFLRAIERGERLYLSMTARGYDGRVRIGTLSPLTRPQRRLLEVGLLVAVFLLLLGWMG